MNSISARRRALLWWPVIFAVISPVDAQAGNDERNRVRVQSLVWAPDNTCPGATYPHRLRGSLVFMDGDKVVEKDPEFWRKLTIREIASNQEFGAGAPAGSPRHVLIQGKESKTPPRWRIIVLVDASRSMLSNDMNGIPRYEAALGALKTAFLGELKGDVLLAIETYNCRFRWANEYKEGGVKWMSDLAQWTAAADGVRDWIGALAKIPASKDAEGMCTALFQAVAEADLYLEEVRHDDGRRAFLLVLGDGVNDLVDPPGDVTTAAGTPKRTFDNLYLASPAEIDGLPPHHANDLDGLLLALGGAPADGREKLRSAHGAFIQNLTSRVYKRWAIGVGKSGNIFDPKALEAFGSRLVMADNPAELTTEMKAAVGSMLEEVQVNFPTSAASVSELNGLRWEFLDGQQVVGTYQPKNALALTLGGHPAKREAWEEYCTGIPPPRSPAVAFFIVLAALAAVWVLVPKYFFSEAQRS